LSKRLLWNPQVIYAIVALVVMMFMAGVTQAEILQHTAPLPIGMDKIVSEDGRVKVWFRAERHGRPNPERYAALWEHMDEFFTTVGRPKNAEVHIYVHTYKHFHRRFDQMYPGAGMMIDEGAMIYWAHTYAALDTVIPVVVIEAWEIPSDSIFIHEMLHHYMDKLAADGSLNNHEIITDYTHQVQISFRKKYRKGF
jgi:hypothetical protein